jgi:hypothetical protein
LRHHPGETVARAIDGERGTKVDDGITGERLEKGDHHLAVARRDGRRVDEGCRGNFIDRPAGQTDREPRHRRPADGDPELGFQHHARLADRVAVLGLDDDPTAPRPDPHRQGRRLGVMGEGGHETGLPCSRGGVDTTVGAGIVPVELPLPRDHQRRSSPLPPAGDPLHREAEGIEGNATGGIDGTLALELHQRHAIRIPRHLHLDDPRPVSPLESLAVDMDQRRGLADADERAAWRQRQPHRPLISRQAVDPHRGVDDGDAAIDPHEALHRHLWQDTGAGRRSPPASDAKPGLSTDPVADDPAPLRPIRLHAWGETDGLDGHDRLRSGGQDHAPRRRRYRQIEDESLAIGKRFQRHHPAEDHRVPIVTTPRHPSAIATGHGLAFWTQPFEKESPRPLDPRVGREDQPREAQRHIDPTIPGLADLERELDAAGVGVAPHPRAYLSDEAFDDQAGRSRHPGQPLALSEEFEKVAVLESGHRHEPATVVREVEDLGGLFDGTRFEAGVGAGHRSIASRLAARRTSGGHAASGAHTPGRLGGGRCGLPCRRFSLGPRQSDRSQPDGERHNDDPHPDRLADRRAGGVGRGGRSLPLWHLHP